MKYDENIAQQRLSYQLNDIADTSANQFHVSADDVHTGECCAHFSTDDCRYVADYSDNATCYGDHYDDNYQVIVSSAVSH